MIDSDAIRLRRRFIERLAVAMQLSVADVLRLPSSVIDKHDPMDYLTVGDFQEILNKET